MGLVSLVFWEDLGGLGEVFMEEFFKYALKYCILFVALYICANIVVYVLCAVGIRYEKPSDAAFLGALAATLLFVICCIAKRKRNFTQ